MTERALQSAAAQYFAAILDPAKVLWFHPMNEGKRGPMARADFALGGGLAGLPDWQLSWVSIIDPGRFGIGLSVLFIELKSTKGRLSPAQQAFKERVLALGHHWALCRTLEQVQAALRSAGAPVRGHSFLASGAVKMEMSDADR